MIGLLEDISCGDQGDKNLTDLIKTIFEPGGLLEKTLDFEHRPEQASMAEVFLNSLEEESHLLFEAGTGVGKSLAYLIPCHSSFEKKKANLCGGNQHH